MLGLWALKYQTEITKLHLSQHHLDTLLNDYKALNCSISLVLRNRAVQTENSGKTNPEYVLHRRPDVYKSDGGEYTSITGVSHKCNALTSLV